MGGADTGESPTLVAQVLGACLTQDWRRPLSRHCHLHYYASRNTLCVMAIQSFACRDTEEMFQTGANRRFGNIARVALRKLDYLNAAAVLSDLSAPPGNHLEPMKRDRIGQHSIRINDQWRICFVWTPAGPSLVEICDYHH